MTRSRTMVLALSGSLLVTGAGCAAEVSTAGGEPTSRPTATTTSTSPEPTTPPAATPEPAPSARRARSVLVPEPPVVVVLPGGLRVRIRSVGTTPAGLLDVPAEVDRAGWWRGGSRLGDPFGSTLVAAHVDSRTEGLGPFAELLTLPRRSRITLSSARLTQEFEVRSRQLLPQGSLVRETWLFDAGGERRLTLVTCAPPYDASRGGYQNLAVITAVPVSPVARS